MTGVTGATRITHRTMQQKAMGNLQANLARMESLQGKLSSGREVSRPSDSPTATVVAMQHRSDIRRAEQHARNAQDGLGWLATADDTLTGVLGVVNRVRELVLRGNNGNMGPDEREAMAAEVDTLRQNLLGLANTRYLNRPLFSGTADATNAYDPSGSYLGDVGDDTTTSPLGKVHRTVGEGVSVRVNLSGPEVFGPPGTDLFALVGQVADHLRNDPSQLTADLGALDAGTLAVQNQLAKIGARYNQIETMRARLDERQLTLRQGLSEAEDVDLPRTIVDLQLQEVAYKSALAATARVVQPSLLDFLR